MKLTTTQLRRWESLPGFAGLAWNFRQKSLAQNVALAESLATANDGILPNQGWLETHGYTSLRHTMRKHPQAFRHIPQARKRQRDYEIIRQAETLAAQFDGILPYPKWLGKNGYLALKQRIHANPAAFAHIRQAHGRPTGHELVIIAVRLAEQHNGILPSRAWRDAHGFSGIHSTIQCYERLFLQRFKRVGRNTSTRYILRRTK